MMKEALERLQREENGKRLHFILPAFFHFIDSLIQQKRRFSIAFRTYGVDLDDVIGALDQYFLGNHPGHHLPTDSDVSSYLSSASPFVDRASSLSYPSSKLLPTGSTIRSSSGTTIVLPDNRRIDSEDQIYEIFSSFEGMIGFRETYQYWASNNWYASKSKPLWVDLSDKSVHHIFFDDGLRDPDPHNQGLEEGNSIVNLRVRENKEEPFKSIPAREYKKYFNMFLVKVDMIDSLLDIDYFIKKTQQCERNFDSFTTHQHN